MAIDSNAYNLADWAERSRSDTAKNIAMNVYKTNNVIKDIPLRTDPSLVKLGKRVTSLMQSNNWRKLNEPHPVVKGQVDDFQEQMYITGAQFQIDRRIKRQPNLIEDPFDTDFKIWKMTFASDFTNKFFNNTHESGDPDAIVGMRARLDNPTKYGTLPAMKIDFGGIDISPANITKTTADNLLSALQSMLDEMGEPEGDGVVFYGNSLTIRRWDSALRTLGPAAGLSTKEDAYGRSVRTFKNAKIRDVGRRLDQTTPIITSTETSTGLDGSSNYTSIYAVRFGTDSFSGWQGEVLDLMDLGVDPTNGIMENAVIDYGVGLLQTDNRAVCRGFNLKTS